MYFDSTLLQLANGAQWSVVGRDPLVRPVISRLAAVMQMGWGGPSPNSVYVRAGEPAEGRTWPWLEEEVVIAPENLAGQQNAGKPSLAENLGPDMCRVASTLTSRMQAGGAVLFHAALAEWHGQGVLFAAPGGTGKTTASNRLPPPWRSLCDDTCLVLPVGSGCRVHPWPTWSRFFWGGPGGTWNVQDSVPLRAIFFLRQAEQDTVLPLAKAEAAVSLLASNDQATHVEWQDFPSEQRKRLRTAVFAVVAGIVQAIPVYRLHLTLKGEFWKLVEPIVPIP